MGYSRPIFPLLLAYLACFSLQCLAAGLGVRFVNATGKWQLSGGSSRRVPFAFVSWQAGFPSFLPGPPLLYIVLCSSCAVAPFQSFGKEAKQVTQWIRIHLWIKLFINTQEVSWRYKNVWWTVRINDSYWSVSWVWIWAKLILLAHLCAVFH